MTNKEMYLKDALAATEKIEQLKNELLATVSGARRNGASWAEIGGVTGMTKQAAQQRWGKLTPAPLPFEDGDPSPEMLEVEANMTDEDFAGTSLAVPSIFLEPEAPAEAWDREWNHNDPAHHSAPMAWRPKACPYCGQMSHQDGKGDTWFYPGCSATLKDPAPRKAAR